MYDRLIFSISELIQFVPCAFLCYRPFIKQIRIPANKLRILLVAIFSFQFFSNLYVPSIISFEKLSIYIFLLIYLIFYLITIKVQYSALLFTFFLVTNYEGIVIGISHLLDVFCFPFMRKTFTRYSFSLICICGAIMAITIPLFINIYKKMESLINQINEKIWDVLWIIPFLFDTILIVFETVYEDKFTLACADVIILLAMGLGSTIVYYIVILMLYKAEEMRSLKEKVRTTDTQLILQKKAYEDLNNHLEEIKRLRHDLKHHLSVIEAYVQENDTEALKAYLNQFKSSCLFDVPLILCENPAVNALLQHYVSLAKAKNIMVSVNLQVPQKISISDVDLCIIFGNCLENALEACQMMTGGEKYICIKSKMQGHAFTLIIENSYNGIVKKKNNVILSSKRIDKEGIGFSSINAVCEKYGGSVFINYDTKKFSTSMVLYSL